MSDRRNPNTLGAFANLPASGTPPQEQLFISQNTTGQNQSSSIADIKEAIGSTGPTSTGGIIERGRETANGIQKTWTLTYDPNPVDGSNVFVYSNGALRTEYTISGRDITFDVAPNPNVNVEWVSYAPYAPGQGGTGGVTQGQNIGTTGFGFYQSVSGDGTTLEFRNISNAPGDATINLAQNVANNTIEVSTNQGGLDHGAIGGQINDSVHGNRGNGALHAVATDTVAGFQSAADKAKSDQLIVAAQTPAGGATGEILKKTGPGDYAYGWAAETGGGGSAHVIQDTTGTPLTQRGNLQFKDDGGDTSTTDDAANDRTVFDVTGKASKTQYDAHVANTNIHTDWGSTTRNFSTSGTLASGTVTVTGNVGVTGSITVTGTVDGRNVSADGAKLDGITAGANPNALQATAGEITLGSETATRDHSPADIVSYLSQHPGVVDHNQTLNYVSGEHINWTNANSAFLTSETMQGGPLTVNGGASDGLYGVTVRATGASGEFIQGLTVAGDQSFALRQNADLSGAFQLRTGAAGASTTRIFGDATPASTVWVVGGNSAVAGFMGTFYGPLFAETPTFADDTDNTKRLSVNLTNVTTATTREFIAPDGDVKFTGGATGHVLTQQADGSFAPEVPAAGSGYAPGDDIDQPNFTTETGASWTGSLSAISPNFNNKTDFAVTLTGDCSGELLAPTGVAGLDNVGDKIQIRLIITQDATGGRAFPSTIFGATNYAGGIQGYFPVINQNTPASTPLTVVLEGEIITGPTTKWTVKMPPRPEEAIVTYSGTAKTWNSDSINDENAYLIFSNPAAKAYTPASTEGMRANDRVTFFNTGAGDLTVAAGAGITLLGDLVFAQNKGGGIVWANATTGHVWGGST